MVYLRSNICLLWLVLTFGAAWITANTATAETFNHTEFDRILRTYVQNGKVDYRNILHQEKGTLQNYLDAIAAANPETLVDENERLAFWINAYNAFTIMGVLEQYPTETIRPSRLGLIPDNSFFRDTKYPVHGELISVDDIEHVILRKQFKEPRIHFAIVCASIGCPHLRSEAYTGEAVDRQLDDQARLFINNPANVRFDISGRVVYLSKIFQWFSSDFTINSSKDKFEFISRYVDMKTSEFLHSGDFDIKYLDYDWSLNDWKR